MVRCRKMLVLGTFLFCGVVPRSTDAQTSTSALPQIEQLARQLQATQEQLEQTQAQLQNMRRRAAASPDGDTSQIRPLPPASNVHRWASYDGGGIVQSHDAGCSDPGCDCCPDCGKKVCQGLPHLCTGCREGLSWNKGKFRVVPYGAVVGEMIRSERTILLRGSPLYLVPGPAPDIEDSRFTVSGQQSTIGLMITGPSFGALESGANVGVNFFGEQPIQNNPGLFFMFAYAELKNENWRFWVGQAPDAIGRQNTNSPAWSSHKMSGNFGQLRPGFRVERFFHPSEMLDSSVYFGLTQQAVNDFIAIPGVSGIDNGWPNAELRWELTLGSAPNGERPVLFAVGGVIGEVRAVDDLAVADINVSTSWAVIPELRLEGERWGFQAEVFAGEAMGTYNGAIGQSLNPEDGEPIYAVGGFGELFWKVTPCFTTSVGYGIDDPRDRDLGVIGNTVGQRARNEKYWLNFIWRLSDEWETRFEVSHLETTYVAPSNDSQSMLYHFLARYIF